MNAEHNSYNNSLNHLKAGDIVVFKPHCKQKLISSGAEIKLHRLIVLSTKGNEYSVVACTQKMKDSQLTLRTNQDVIYVNVEKIFYINADKLQLCKTMYFYDKQSAVNQIYTKHRSLKRNSRFLSKQAEFKSNNAQSDVLSNYGKRASKTIAKNLSQELSEDAVNLCSDTLLQIPVMESIGSKCPFCKKEFSGMSNIRYQLGDESVHYTSARTCSSCKLVILDPIQFQQTQNQVKNIRIPILRPSAYKSASELMLATKRPPNVADPENTVKLLPYEQEARRPINLSEHGKKVLIFAKKCHCAQCFKKYKKHTIVPRTAKVFSASGYMVDVTVMFCAGCGQYYMGYESFKRYKKEYGRLLFECELSNELQHSYPAFGDFSPDSVLSRWGYSVKKDTPKEHRQAILSFLLDTGRIHKFEVVEMIKGFISLRENQPKFKDACERWREDILFINNYRIKGQNVVYGLTFKQGGKISR